MVLAQLHQLHRPGAFDDTCQHAGIYPGRGIDYLFSRSVSTPLLIAPPLAFGGLALIVWPEWQTIGASFQKGVFLGLAAAFFYALYLLSLRRLQRLYGGSSLFYPLMLVSAISSILLGVLALLRNTSLAIPTSHSLGALVAFFEPGSGMGVDYHQSSPSGAGRGRSGIAVTTRSCICLGCGDISAAHHAAQLVWGGFNDHGDIWWHGGKQ